MQVHKGIHGETLDDTALRLGAEESDLVTVGATGVVEFDTPEEREWYEGRVEVESKRIRGRRKYKAMVERNRETAKNRKDPTFPVCICLNCGKEYQPMGPRSLFCTISGPGNCKAAYYKTKKNRSIKEE